jgi:hypothetical protein
MRIPALLSLLFAFCGEFQSLGIDSYFVLKGSRAAQDPGAEPFVFAHNFTVGATGASSVRSSHPYGFELTGFPTTGFGENDIVDQETAYTQQRQLRIDMEALHPDAVYELTLNETFVAPLEITVSEIPIPGSPRILNMNALTNANANFDVVLQWAPLPSNDTNDYIHFRLITEILDGRSVPEPEVVFRTSVPGKSGVLAATNTSLIIPRGTLIPNSRYWAKLLFVDVRTTDTNTVPGAIGYTGIFSQTTFFLDTGRPADPARFTSTFLGETTIELHLLVPTNTASFSIESSIDLRTWTPFETNVALEGTSILSLPRTQKPHEFFRARSQ